MMGGKQPLPIKSLLSVNYIFSLPTEGNNCFMWVAIRSRCSCEGERRMILNVSLDLPGDGVYLRVARHISRTLLEDLGVVSEDIDDMEFVLGELGSIRRRRWPT